MFHIYADGKDISQPFVRELAILSPKLILELGKAGSFEFSMPPCHAFYDKLKKLKTIITVKMDDVEMFRGRYLSHQRAFNNVKKVYAEGCLAYLVDTEQKNEKYEGTTHALFRKVVADHNAQTDPEKRFEVGIIGIEDREIIIVGTSEEYENLETGEYDYKQIAINSTSKERMTTFDYIESNIIEYCGGYLRTRVENGVTYLDLLGQEGVNASQPIRFGVNMLDLTEEATAEEVFSVLVPIGDENLTIVEANSGSEELVDAEALALFGRIVKSHVFDSVSDAAILKENGLRFIENHENMPITFTIKAIDMHMVDPNVTEIHLGDSVMVKSQPHNLDMRLLCTRIEYDLEKPENTTYTFGNQKQTLTQRYQKDKSDGSKNNSSSSGSGGASSAVEKKVMDRLEAHREWLNEKTGELNKQWAEVNTKVDDLSSTVEAHAAWSKELEGKTEAWHSELVLKANANGEAIALLRSQYEERVAALELKVDKNHAEAVLKADFEEYKKAQLKLYSDAEKSIADLRAEHDKKIADLQLYVDDEMAKAVLKTDFNSKIAELELLVNDKMAQAVLKADFEEYKKAQLKLYSDAEKSIADLRAEHDKKIANLQLYVDDEMAKAVLKADYNADKKSQDDKIAALELRATDLESTASLTATHGDKIAALEEKANNLESSVVLKAQYDKDIASITAKATEQGTLIEAKADNVTVEAIKTEIKGLLKVENLKSEIANLDILSNGSIQSDYVDTTDLVAQHASITGSLTLNGVAFTPADYVKTSTLSNYATRAWVTETFESQTEASQTFSDIQNQIWDISTAHTLTIGSKSCTFYGPSDATFDWSDIQEVKDALNAAKTEGASSVTLTGLGWQSGVYTVKASNEKSFRVDLPSFSVSGGDTFNAEHKTTVHFYTDSVGVPLRDKVVDATSVYNAGVEAGKSEGGASTVTLSAAGWVGGSNVVSAKKGDTVISSVTVNLPTFSVSGGDTFDSTSHKTTVYFSTSSVSDPLKSKEVDATSVYNSGKSVGASSVTLTGAGWQGGSYKVSASNKQSHTVNLPAFSVSGGDNFNTEHKTTVYFSTSSVSSPLKSKEVDATSVYNSGVSAGYTSGLETGEEWYSATRLTPNSFNTSTKKLNVKVYTAAYTGGISDLDVDASKAYDAGKSSGASSVTLSAAGWVGGSNVVSASNGKSVTVNLPAFSVSGGDNFNTEHKTTVYFSTSSVSSPLKSKEVDASSVYSSGIETGYTNGLTTGETWYKATSLTPNSFNTSTKKLNVKVYTAAYTGGISDLDVDASKAYDAGKSSGASSVTLSAAGWVGGSNVVSASNGQSVTVKLPTFSVSGGDTFDATSHKTTVYFSTSSVSDPLKSKEVDATSVYDAGYDAGYKAAKEAVKVTAGISQQGFPAQYYARFYYWGKATIGDEEVGSANGYKSFNVKGAM